MLRLLADENLNAAIVRGLVRAMPGLDIVTVQDVGLAGVSDPDVLEFAASAGRLLLTHDIRTMPAFVHARLRTGSPMLGVFEIAATLPIGQAIDEILLLVQCSEEGEWANQIVRLPL